MLRKYSLINRKLGIVCLLTLLAMQSFAQDKTNMSNLRLPNSTLVSDILPKDTEIPKGFTIVSRRYKQGESADESSLFLVRKTENTHLRIITSTFKTQDDLEKAIHFSVDSPSGPLPLVPAAQTRIGQKHWRSSSINQKSIGNYKMVIQNKNTLITIVLIHSIKEMKQGRPIPFEISRQEISQVENLALLCVKKSDLLSK